MGQRLSLALFGREEPADPSYKNAIIHFRRLGPHDAALGDDTLELLRTYYNIHWKPFVAPIKVSSDDRVGTHLHVLFKVTRISQTWWKGGGRVSLSQSISIRSLCANAAAQSSSRGAHSVTRAYVRAIRSTCASSPSRPAPESRARWGSTLRGSTGSMHWLWLKNAGSVHSAASAGSAIRTRGRR